MKKRDRLRKGLAILLTATMVVGLMPGTGTLQAQAEESQEVTTPSTTKTIAGLGTGVIADPTDPGDDTTKAWAGSYVYYGNYDADGDGTAEPVKYRVLDASTTRFGGTTMLLDCDSILYYQKFDNDGTANETGKKANDWSISDVKSSLNGDGFLNKEGVFTTAEKNAIAKSTVATHPLTTDSETGVNVTGLMLVFFENYVALTGEQIFLLDAEDVSNRAYGYSMTDETTKNREKRGSSVASWWLRSAYDSDDINAGFVNYGGSVFHRVVNFEDPGVSPALNLNLQSVLFSSVISGTAGETGAEYKLTLLDDGMTIEKNGDATRYGKTITIPYHISGNNSNDATQVSVLILDKEYTVGNTNSATVLDYQKLDVDGFSASGTGTYTLPDSLYRKGCGTDYHMYILAEDVNGEKETDYASTPVEIIPTWKAPTVKEMNFGTKGIIDPAVPNSASDSWKGCYVYYGNYNGSPVKYRVLDASTTRFGGTTMLLDCDSILYYTPFDADGKANEDGKKANDWSISDVKSSLNGDGFLNKEGVFTTAEKNAIAKSTVDTHTLTTDSETGVNVTGWTQSTFANYVALTGEQIFLLDAEDVSNGAYGYSMTDEATENRKKTGSSAASWWLRSASNKYAGCVYDGGHINDDYVAYSDPGVSPALNLNLSSVLFSSANEVSKSSALTSSSTKIGTVANTEWKLTLKDDAKSVKLTEGRSVTKASDGTITVPYTYTDKENATESENVNQISVMITDKAYGSENAQILYYGALQNVQNTAGEGSTVAEASTGTGTFALPSSLTGTLGTDYHIYLLAEHVNADNSTDYASEPVEVTAIKTPIDSVTVTELKIDTPKPEQPLQTKIDITTDSTSVSSTAALTWKKGETVATGDAEWKTTYQAYMTLTATEGYALVDATGVMANATLNGSAVDSNKITLNNDGTQMTIDCGAYTTATRKTTGAEEPQTPTQFANYYTADDVLSSTELGKAAKVTLEGTTQPNPEEMEVEWAIVDAEGNATTYNATPETTNTFKWTVKSSEYADYNKDNAVLEGTVVIKNKDYTPVTISGSDVTVTYGGTLDVSQYFTIDENAGTPTYELSDTSTGTGRLDGATLTMTTLGTFVVKVSTPINGVYNKGEHTLTITVNKATPDVETLPTVDDRTYHPSNTLVDEDLKGGTVKGVDGKPLAGTWNWKTADVIPTVENSGYVAVFTPTDTDNYNTISKTITVNVAKATPYIKTAPTAAAITYGDTLAKATITGRSVQYSSTDDTAVAGTFAWKLDTTKPAVADSDKTAYKVVFTPTNENYNTVETDITVTVNKAPSAPNKPDNTMEADYTKEKVSDITTLPEGWAWKDADKEKALTVGTAVAATAVYTGADKGNYEIESVEISITRLACTHATTEVRNAKEATCTEKGYTGDTCCTVCGKVITAGADIDALGHDMKKTVSAEVKATCTEAGKEAVMGCSRCDHKEGGAVINALGHDIAAEFTVDKEATCSEAGSKSKHCSRCEKKDEVTPIPKTEHTWDAGAVTKEATCTEKGVLTYTCEVCQETKTEDIAIDKSKHGETEIKDAKDATCTEKGYTGDNYCQVCGEKVKTGQDIDALGHDFAAEFTVDKEATCTEAGSKSKHCSRCEEKTEVTAIPAKGHTWDAGKVTKVATETAEGVKTYTCSVCGKTKTEAIPKKTTTTPQPPKKGDVVKDDKKSAKVEVTDAKKKEVAYEKPANKKAKPVSIPSTVKINGVTYKVTKIADNAFKGNKTVTKVTVGSNIKTIGKNAFSGATKLKTVKVGKNVTEIGANAFKGCSSLTSVTLPSKTTKIGANAFNGCKKLKTIKITSTKLTSKTVAKNAFKGLTKATTIKVPKKKLAAYKRLFKQKGLSSKVKVKGY